MGDSYDNGLNDPSIPSYLGAKSRWIVQGFRDPDIAILDRTVPTPGTSDVLLTLQPVASMRARIFAGDIKSAFMQSQKGLRKEPLFASMLSEGMPGEDDPDTLIELLAEVYGLITGPPGWRRTLIQGLKQLDFKAHPLAPCIVF